MSSKTTIQRELTNARQRWASWLDAAALFVVLLVVGMRPLLSETYESSLDSIAQVTQCVGDFTPATTAWLDLSIWAAGLATAASALLGRRRWQLCGIEIGAVVLVVAAVVSTLTASNKRLALNASFSWLTALVLVIVVANLCRDRLRIGLLLAVLGASGLASVTRCAMQKAVEFEETRQYYEQRKDETWSRQNVPLDDPRVELYECRLNAAEVSGFFPMSNNQAAWLALAGFVFLGLRGLIVRNRRVAAILLVPAVLAFGTIPFTGSKGGLFAVVGGIVVWLVLSRVYNHLRHRWFMLFVAAWVGLGGIVLAVAAYGIATGGLPTDSLRFRWNYWQVTRDIIVQNLATGVGALNFDNAYLQVKPVQFPEEIRDPHNFLLSIVAQWGMLGGLGLLAVFVGGSYVAARTWGTRESADAPPPVYEPQARNAGLAWMVAISVGYVLLRLMLMRGWLGDASGSAFVFFDMGLYGLVWILAFAGLVWLSWRSWMGDIELCQVACLAAALTFVVHNLIDCAMFYPGTLLPFAAMVGLLTAARPVVAGMATSPTRGRLLACAIFAVGVIASVVLVVVPVTLANSYLTKARFASASAEDRVKSLQLAVEADRFDPTALTELAKALAMMPGGDLNKAMAAINEATWRDPQQAALYRFKSGLLEMSSRQSGSMADVAAAIGVAGKAVSLYPNSPEDHEWIADLIVRTGVAGGSEYWANEAIGHYRTALELNDLRAAGEIRRWSPEQRRNIEQRIHAVAEQVASQPATAAEDSASSQPTGRAGPSSGR